MISLKNNCITNQCISVYLYRRMYTTYYILRIDSPWIKMLPLIDGMYVTNLYDIVKHNVLIVKCFVHAIARLSTSPFKAGWKIWKCISYRFLQCRSLQFTLTINVYWLQWNFPILLFFLFLTIFLYVRLFPLIII